MVVNAGQSPKRFRGLKQQKSDPRGRCRNPNTGQREISSQQRGHL